MVSPYLQWLTVPFHSSVTLPSNLWGNQRSNILSVTGFWLRTESWKFCSWTYWFGTQVIWFGWWEAEIGPVEKAGMVDELEMASWETLKLIVQWKQTGDQLLTKFPKMLPAPRNLCYLSHCLHSDGTSWWDFACPYLALFSGFISFLIIVVTMNIWFLHDISFPSPHFCWSQSCRVLSVLKVHLQLPPCKNS